MAYLRVGPMRQRRAGRARAVMNGPMNAGNSVDGPVAIFHHIVTRVYGTHDDTTLWEPYL